MQGKEEFVNNLPCKPRLVKRSKLTSDSFNSVEVLSFKAKTMLSHKWIKENNLKSDIYNLSKHINEQ